MTSRSRYRWGRIVAAAVMSEVAVILTLLLVMAIYRFLIAPGKTAAEYQEFNALASYYVAPAAAGLAVFVSALWAMRKLASDFMAHGLLVGAAAVALTIGFVFSAKPEDRLMYGVSYALRIVAGFAAGYLAQARFTGDEDRAGRVSV